MIVLNVFLFAAILLFTGFISFLIGRYLLFKKSGIGVVTNTKVVPLKTVYTKDFKGEQIYKAMASKLLRERHVNVTSKDIDKTIEKLAKLTKTNKERFDKEQIEGETWKVFLK